MPLHESIASAVGQTPVVPLRSLGEGLPARVVVKIEYFNPMSSVKDRIGVSMIDDAERSGTLAPGGVLIEPTSGNTGIALAFVAAARGYRLILTMPDDMSVERRKLLTHLGAEIELTPARHGMMGAVEKARALLARTEGAQMLQQFENPANPRIHEETTGPELWDDLDGEIDVFVAGVGTGGTISGVGRFLKSKNDETHVVAVEPERCAVLSGKPPGPHAIQGIGAGFVPSTLDQEILDEVMVARADRAYNYARRLAAEEGILAGISSGANVWAALELAKRPALSGATIATVIPSCGERYLSTPLFR